MQGEGTMARKYTENRAAANKRSDEKTYKTIAIRLRLSDDADLLESFNKARAAGKTGREWIRSLKDEG